MKNRKLLITAAVAAVLAGLPVQPVHGANIAVTNVGLVSAMDADHGAANVKFDVSWDASWRESWTESGTWTNWDAAWIFVKYRCRTGADTNWHHATLSTNNSDHFSPTGSTINVGLSTNAGGTNFGAGVFLYRSAEGSGSWANTGVKLRWQHTDDGVASMSRVDVCVHAIEMVYVPQGSFYLGDGTMVTADIYGQFEYGKFTNAFLVTNDNYIIYLGGGTNGNLGNNNTLGMSGGIDDFNDDTGQILPATFPKGYSAFYCMKYEISQGQYADFLNQLSYTQATNRYANTNGYYRYTISGSYPAYTSSAPARACNYLNWADGAAYGDWAGLRPMTELEYEKAGRGRGPLNAVAREYAWGTATKVADIRDETINVSSPENGTETETNTTDISLGVAVYGDNEIKVASVNSGKGPARCELFATANSSRQAAGASYWGIMEMTGNLWERLVTVGNETGRGFTGTHGDGKLDINGNADVPSWPGTTASGAGFRGRIWYGSAIYLRASARTYAAFTYSIRGSGCGWRAGRSAPVVNP